MNFILALICAIGALKTTSFGVWCLKTKNVVGGIFVLILALFSFLSIFVII